MGAKHVTGASAIRIRVVSGGGSAAANSDFKPRMSAVPARVGPRRNSRRLHPFSPWIAMAILLSKVDADSDDRGPLSLKPSECRNKVGARLRHIGVATTGTTGCCARAAHGDAAAPPSSAMNSRLLMSNMEHPPGLLPRGDEGVGSPTLPPIR